MERKKDNTGRNYEVLEEIIYSSHKKLIRTIKEEKKSSERVKEEEGALPVGARSKI